jgi:hypothetical protein
MAIYYIGLVIDLTSLDHMRANNREVMCVEFAISKTKYTKPPFCRKFVVIDVNRKTQIFISRK